MRFKQPKKYFYQIENFAYGEINKRNFSKPTLEVVIFRTTFQSRIQLSY